MGNYKKKIIDPVSDEAISVCQKMMHISANGPDETIIHMTMVDGILQSVDDQPAYRKSDKITGRDLLLKWYDKGLEHRNGNPSTIGFFCSGKTAYQHWCVEGQFHRFDGPSLERYDEERGSLVYAQYAQNGMEFRTDGPFLYQVYPSTGVVEYEEWRTNPSVNGLYREDGPARIHRDKETGIATQQFWLQDNILARIDNQPPYIKRDSHSGIIVEESWSHEFYSSVKNIGFYHE